MVKEGVNMAQRFIPRKSKLKLELFRNFTLGDIILAIVGVAAALFIFFSNLPYHIYIGIAFTCFWVMLFIPVTDDVKLYYSVILMFRFFSFSKVFKKKYTNKNQDISRILPYVGINTEKFIVYGEYYGMVLQIDPIEFGLLEEEKQESVIQAMTNALSRVNVDQKVSIIKVKKPMILDNLMNFEDYKYNTLLDMADKGLYDPEEVERRGPVFEERLSAIKLLNYKEKVLKNYYYIIVYDKDRDSLQTTIMGMKSALEQSQVPVYSDVVEGDQLYVFLKSNYNSEFDERDLNILNMDDKMKWTKPDEIRFGTSTTKIDGMEYRTFTIYEYPIQVPNAWAYSLFELDKTRVVVNLEPMVRYKAEKMLNKSLMDISIKLRKSGTEGDKIMYQTQYDTLLGLLEGLKTGNENLFDVNFHIVAEESEKKEVRAQLKQQGYRYSENFGRQVDAFISSGPSRLDKLNYSKRGIQSSTIAAMFPFISSAVHDEKGFYLGYNQYPVFVNFFKRDGGHTNSNMMIIGKSGGGKSYATKTLLTNFAADNTRVFILDPENEYEYLCKHLGGKNIDVGNSSSGIFNPFHIFTSLKEEEGEGDDSFNGHLQFLEQFFRLILPGMNSDSFEILNSLVIQAYAKKGIDANTPIEGLQPEDFPIFDDLMDVIKMSIETVKDEYLLKNLQVIKVYIEKFATGGRNANLWNGPTSIVTNENFVCFNFRNLVGNRNDVITNAQMLLVFKYLDNEIMKNMDFNKKYFADVDNDDEEDFRRIIIAVDEAHVFINPKYPIALDFMANMAKRIRKYHGMQIIITQNIKDFVGTEEIARQSTAVINACQYSMIFGLAPNDVTDLLNLYRNAGGINDQEKDQIVTSPRGQCFLITSPTNRTLVQIEALPTVIALFSKDEM